MKTFSYLVLVLWFTTTTPAFAYNNEKKVDKNLAKKVASIEVYEKGERVAKKYKFISPVSEKARNEQRILKSMKKYAAKIDADAIIEFECLLTAQQDVTFELVRTTSVCRGKAVKWIN